METESGRVSPSPSPENIPTEERPIKCQSCETVGVAVWTKAQEKTWVLMGKTRTLVIPPELVRQDFRDYCAPCQKVVDAKRAAQKRELAMRERENSLADALGSVKIVRDFTLDSYHPVTPSQTHALTVCRGFNPKFENLCLMGPAGVGKSHLACATAISCFDKGSTVKRYRVTELLRLFRVKREAAEEEALIRVLVNCNVLVIEDMGVQKDTDWGGSVLWEVIDRRIEQGNNGLIVTTNLGRSDMAEKMGDRIPSRLSKMCTMLKIDGPDGRLVELALDGGQQ